MLPARTVEVLPLPLGSLVSLKASSRLFTEPVWTARKTRSVSRTFGVTIRFHLFYMICSPFPNIIFWWLHYSPFQLCRVWEGPHGLPRNGLGQRRSFPGLVFHRFSQAFSHCHTLLYTTNMHSCYQLRRYVCSRVYIQKNQSRFTLLIYNYREAWHSSSPPLCLNWSHRAVPPTRQSAPPPRLPTIQYQYIFYPCSLASWSFHSIIPDHKYNHSFNANNKTPRNPVRNLQKYILKVFSFRQHIREKMSYRGWLTIPSSSSIQNHDVMHKLYSLLLTNSWQMLCHGYACTPNQTMSRLEIGMHDIFFCNGSHDSASYVLQN